MDALVTGPLSTARSDNFAEQAYSLALYSLACSRTDANGRSVAYNALRDETSSGVFQIVSYPMAAAEVVAYALRERGVPSVLASCEAIASELSRLTGTQIPVVAFIESPTELNYQSAIVVKSTDLSSTGTPRFEVSDLQRRKEVSQRTGGDCNSGLIALGAVTGQFVDLVRQLADRLAMP